MNQDFSNRRILGDDHENLDEPHEDDEENLHGNPSTIIGGPRVALKFLASNNLAGALIGKKGASMRALQTETGARIKVSHTTEHFPGTQERVVLITGAESAVVHATGILVEKSCEVRLFQPHFYVFMFLNLVYLD